MKNRIIRTSREGWILVDISTPTYPESYMHIDADDWKYLQSLNCGRISAGKGNEYTIYAKCHIPLGNGKYKLRRVHKLLLDSKFIDHKNHNGIDNRRSNIRPCTKSQNCMNRRKRSDNTSGIVGVYKFGKKWRAYIQINCKRKFLGCFPTSEEAVKIRQVAEEKYYGKFAYQQ